MLQYFIWKKWEKNTGLKSGRHSLWWGRKGGKNKSCKIMFKNKTTWLPSRKTFWTDGAEHPMPNTRKMKSFNQTNLLWNSVTAPSRLRVGHPEDRAREEIYVFLHCFQTLGSNRLLTKQMPEGYLGEKADGVCRWPLITIYFLSPKATYVKMAWSLREYRDITVTMSSHCHERRQNVATESST